MPQVSDHPETSPTGAKVRGWDREWHARGEAGGTLVERVLAVRGLVPGEARDRFLEPSLTHLHDPSLLPGVDQAAERLLRAARGGEAIVIYGDYDVDGVSATAILYHTILAVAPEARVGTYVPHRLEEGYGLNAEAIRELAASGAKVIVSVDCGITAVGPALAAREAGVDLIVTDHHNLPAAGGALPDACVLVHPRLPGSAYPFGDLCGAGVAYKVAWRLATMASGSTRVSDALRALLIELLPLAALGVIADVVPLQGENRVIARFGLSRTRASVFEGLRALVRASKLDGDKVSAEDVGFRLGPRLNACGRMGHAREAVELLTTARGQRATEIAEMLTRLNDERRATERTIAEQAARMAEAGGMTQPQRRAIVLADRGWHAGVVGIVCSRLVEMYHRPTLLLCEHDGVCHGSGRSVDGVDLHAALHECAPMLLSFGGHEMAAGLRVEASRLEEFTREFTRVINDRLPPERLVGRVTYDTDVRLGELSAGVVEQFKRLGPFGRENPAVKLRLRDARVVGRAETLGAHGAHLAMRLGGGAGGSGGPVVRAVAWKRGAWATRVPAGAAIEAVVSPTLNEWGGRTTLELELHDLRVV